VDRPIAGLLTDLKARGLLDSTLVVWHGEFGRMPISQRGVGREPQSRSHEHVDGGSKGQRRAGHRRKRRIRYKAEQQPISIHDLHATVLHLMGMDHTKLTHLYNGRNMRLTDVYGDPIPQIVSS